MKGTPAIYLGRIVDKKHFRVVVYGANGIKKLVNSWDEFEALMQTGLWFATENEANSGKAKPKRKVKAKQKSEIVDNDENDDVLIDDGSVFEVTDELLSNENK